MRTVTSVLLFTDTAWFGVQALSDRATAMASAAIETHGVTAGLLPGSSARMERPNTCK